VIFSPAEAFAGFYEKDCKAGAVVDCGYPGVFEFDFEVQVFHVPVTGLGDVGDWQCHVVKFHHKG